MLTTLKASRGDDCAIAATVIQLHLLARRVRLHRTHIGAVRDELGDGSDPRSPSCVAATICGASDDSGAGQNDRST